MPTEESAGTERICSSHNWQLQNRWKQLNKGKNYFGLLRFRRKWQWSAPFGSRAFAAVGTSVLPVRLSAWGKQYLHKKVLPLLLLSLSLPGERPNALHLLDLALWRKAVCLPSSIGHVFLACQTHTEGSGQNFSTGHFTTARWGLVNSDFKIE